MRYVVGSVATALFLLTAVGFLGCAQMSGSRRVGDAAVIEAEADAALRAMCATLAGAKSFSFRAESSIDEILDYGQIVQYSASRKVQIRRPDRMRVEAQAGDVTRQV